MLDVTAPDLLGRGLAARVLPGTGERVLWIHGYTLDSSIWHQMWQGLPAWYHIGIDLPGHGASPPFAPQTTLAELGRTIGALALEHDVRHVVGLSFGGMIALQVAIEFPDAFATLTLGAPGLAGGPEDPAARLRYIELTQLYWQRGPGPWITDLWMQSPPDLFKGALRQPALWQELVAVINRHPWSEMRTGSMQQLRTHPQTEESLRQIKTATMVLVGEDEMPAFKHIAHIIQRSIPHCRSVHLPATSHLCMLESVDLASQFIELHLRAHRQQA